jgi:hypothetical protein
MKANELRIGNLINIDDCLTEITGITKSTVFFDNGFQMFIAGGIEPIPLTEYWLLRYGFEKTERRFMQIDQNVFAIHSFSIPIQNGKFIYDYIGGNIELKYVHQLQNLYFASTGEELLIKD